MEPGDGLFGQWRQGAFAVRGLAHLAAAAESSRGRRPVGRLVGLVSSLAGDLVLSARAGTSRRDRLLECAVNTVDAAVWALLVRDAPIFARTAVIATVVPTALETGFRLGAGTAAVPVMEPALPWTPAWDPPLPRLLTLPRDLGASGRDRSPRAGGAAPRRLPRPIPARLVRLGWEISRDVVPPIVAMAAVRRVRGLRLGWGPLGWVAFSAVGGYALARTRDDAQVSTTATWDERTASIIDEVRVGSRVQAALVHNIATVDPKSMLSYLAGSGSDPARRAIDALRSQPVDTLRQFRSQGTILRQAAENRSVSPSRDATRWVQNVQVRQLRRAIDEIDERIEGSASFDDGLEVLHARGSDLIVIYRGEQVTLTRAAPELAMRLEPTVPALVLGASWTALGALPALGSAPWWAVVAALGLQAVAIGRVMRRPALSRRADGMAAFLVAGATAISDLAIGLRQREVLTPDGFSQCPATGATQTLVLLLACNWRDLPRERLPLAGLAAAGWLFAMRRPGRRPAGVYLGEIAFLLMPALATASIGADTRREAAALDEHLDERLAERLDRAARLTASEELRSFVDQLRTVVDELPTYAGDMDNDDVEAILALYRTEIDRLTTADPLTVINW